MQQLKVTACSETCMSDGLRDSEQGAHTGPVGAAWWLCDILSRDASFVLKNL